MQDMLDIAEDSEAVLPLAFRFKRDTTPASQADSDKEDDKKCKQSKNKPSKQ